MKKIISILGMSAALLFTNIANADVKVAVVDVVSILQKMPQRDTVRKALDNEFSSKIQSLKADEKKANDASNNLKKNGLTLSNSDKNKLAKTISDFENKAQAFSAEYRKRESEEIQKLLTKIQGAVNDIVKTEKYDVVLKAEATVYFSDAIDISSKVLDKVKK